MAPAIGSGADLRLVCPGLFCLGLVCLGLVCPGLVCPGLVCPGLVCPGLVCPGLVCCGLVCPGLVWSALFWSLDRPGLSWSVLVCPGVACATLCDHTNTATHTHARTHAHVTTVSIRFGGTLVRPGLDVLPKERGSFTKKKTPQFPYALVGRWCGLVRILLQGIPEVVEKRNRCLIHKRPS